MHAEKLYSGAECKQHQAWHFEGVQRDYLCNRSTHIEGSARPHAKSGSLHKSWQPQESLQNHACRAGRPWGMLATDVKECKQQMYRKISLIYANRVFPAGIVYLIFFSNWQPQNQSA